MRKLKLLAALLATMTVIASSSVSPALADHWDYDDDPWGECGWMEVWDDSIFYPYYEFEGYEYDCHEDYWDYSDGPYGYSDGPYRDGPYRDGPYRDGPYNWDHHDD